MVRIPTQVNRRSVQTGSQFLRTVSADTSVGRATQNLGRAIGSLSGAFAEQEDKTNRFNAEKQLIEFQNRSRRQLIESSEQEMPEDGKGFFQNTMGKVNDDLKNTLKRIDPALRQEYEVKLMRSAGSVGNGAARLESGQRKQFIGQVTTEKVTQLSTSVSEGLTKREDAIAEMETFIKEVGFSKNVSDALRRDIGRAVDAAHLENLRRNNPGALFQELEKYRLTGAAKGVKGVPLQIINASRLHNIDPTYMLMVSKLESGFNPFTTASKTIAGPFQMTRATRRKYGVPENMKFDVGVNAAAFAQLTRDNEAILQRNGLPINNTNRWGMHFLGAGGFVAFMRANKNADAYQVYRAVAGRNIANQAFNGSNGKLLRPGMTVGQVLNRISGKVASNERAVRGMVGPETSEGAPVKAGEIEILGTKLPHLQPSDLMRFYAGSRDDLRKGLDRERQAASRQSIIIEGAGNPYDPSHRKAANKAAEVDRQNVSEGDPETITSYMALARKGFLPRPIAESAGQMLTNADPTIRATGYELLATTHYADPVRGLEHSSVPAEIKKRVELYAGIRATTGASPSQAAAEVQLRYSDEYRNRVKVQRGQSTDRDLIAKRTWTELDNKLNVDQTYGLGLFGNDASPITPTAQRQMTLMYQKRFEHHLKTGDDEDTAVTKAVADMARMHGNTTILGKNRFMMFPPESFYPVGPDGTHNYVRRQISKAVDSHVQQSLAEINKIRKAQGQPFLEEQDVPIEDVELVANQASGLDFLGGRHPRYTIFYKSPITGEIEMIPGARPFDPAQTDVDVGVAGEKDPPAKAAPANTPGVDIGAARRERSRQREQERQRGPQFR